MKRALIHIILTIVVAGNVFSQDQKRDSLEALSKVITGNELGRIYHELSLEFSADHPDSALYFANQAELILTKDDPDLLLPFVYKNKGKIYQSKVVYDRSLSYFLKAYEEFIKLGIQKEIGACAHSIGNIYFELGDYSDSYSFYLQSLNAYEKYGDRAGIARMENNLGTVSHEMGNLDDAERHYLNSYEIYSEKHNIIEESRALGNLGLIQYDKQHYDSALFYFNQVLLKLDTSIIDNTMRDYILTGVYNNLALLYIDQDEKKMALKYLRQGLVLADRNDDQFDLGMVYTNLGSLFGKMDQQDSALYYLHRALRIATQREFRHLELEVYGELSKLHAGIGNFGSAYNWQLRYDTVYKTVFNEIQSKQIAQLRARYKQEISEQEIEQLQSESQVQRMLNKVFIIFIVVTVALAIIIAVNLRAKKYANRMLAERNIQITKTMEQLSDSEKKLQNLNKSKDRIFSVVAHDLRNPVAAVTGFSELLYDNFEQFPVETQKDYLLQILQGTQRIQNLLENLLIWARSQMKAVKYEPDLISVKSVLDECVKELKANLDHKKVKCMVKINRNCTVFADKAMIHTVFRNLIMNAVKFSFPGGKIRITHLNSADFCQISVADDGIGIQPEIQNRLFDSNEVVSTPGTTGESGSGLGLVICREFLTKNNGTIEVDSEPGNGSTFTVTLPTTERL